MQSSRGPEDGIITVSGKQSNENMDPIGLQLHSLRRVEINCSYRDSRCNVSQEISNAEIETVWCQQVPPLLQESQDPAWRGLQQDLQIMHRKDAGKAPPASVAGPIGRTTGVANTRKHCEGYTLISCMHCRGNDWCKMCCRHAHQPTAHSQYP